MRDYLKNNLVYMFTGAVAGWYGNSFWHTVIGCVLVMGMIKALEWKLGE